MINLQVVQTQGTSVKNQFVVTADEPVTIEFVETANGHTLAHVYRGSETDEYSEPIGAFDSSVEPSSWTIE